MKILLLSNYLNHHQAPLCDCLAARCGEFLFVETGKMPQERVRLGYPRVYRDYCIQAWEEPDLVKERLRTADVVIAGAAPEAMMRQRIRTGKLLLRYSERLFKQGPELLKYLPRLLRFHWRNPLGKPVWLLCAGTYVAEDYGRFGLFREKSLQWGYFPEMKRYDIHNLMEKKNPREILWCGRLLDWKRPMDALEAAARLQKRGLSFHLTFLGDGEQKQMLLDQVRDRRMEPWIDFLGPLPPERVRRRMETAGIFLFTSGAQEGWGAVLNEAMNSGCGVIASSAAGATGFLVEDQKNGLVFEPGNMEELTENLYRLLIDPALQQRLGKAAYETIVGLWNPETAAQRLVMTAESIISENPLPNWTSGPCSLEKGNRQV